MVAYKAEVWKLPHLTPWAKLIPVLKYENLVCQVEMNDIGYGRVIFTGDDDTISDIIDTANDHASIIRIFDDQEQNVFSFWSEFLDQVYEPQGMTTVHGPGIGSILGKMIVQPKNGLNDDDPDWLWGSEENLLTNPGFEDEPLGIANPGFEDGNRLPWWAGAIDGKSATLAVQTSVVDTGTYAAICTPLLQEGGMSTNIRLVGDKEYHITMRFRGVSGVEYQFGVTSQDSVPLLGSAFFETENTQEVQKRWNGTGGWQTIELDFKSGKNQTSTQLSIRESETFNGGPFYVDNFTMTGFGIGIDPWTISQQIDRPNPLRYGEYDVFEVTDEEAHSGTYSLKINPGALGRAYAGAQQVVSVKPLTTYHGSVWVYPMSSEDFRFVVRSPIDELLVEETMDNLTPFEWTQITLPPFKTLANQTRAIFRIANAEQSGNPSAFFVDDAELFEGIPAAPVGEILHALIDPIQARGVGAWLDTSTFDDTTDSNGNPWTRDEGIGIPPGQSILQVLDAFVDMGYEWLVEWDDDLEVFALKVYNYEGLGEDKTDTLTFHPREGWRPTVYQESMPPYTAVLGEGDPGIWAYEEDAGMVSGYGRLEGSASLSGVGIPSVGGLTNWLTQQLGIIKDHRFAIRAEVASREDRRFGTAWSLGDKVNFAFPDTHIGLKSERIHSLQILAAAGDEADLLYTLDFVKTVLIEPPSGTTSAPTSYVLNRFLRKFNRKITSPSLTAAPIAATGGGSGGAPTIVVAASDATQASKDKADFVCTGIGDEQVVQTAAALMPSGGRIILTEGVFRFTTDIVFLWNIHLLGLGPATIIEVSGSGTAIEAQDCIIENIYFREPQV